VERAEAVRNLKMHGSFSGGQVPSPTGGRASHRPLTWSRPPTGSRSRPMTSSTGGGSRPITGSRSRPLTPLEQRVEDAVMRQVRSRPQTPSAPRQPAESDTKTGKTGRISRQATPTSRPSTAARLLEKQRAAAAAVAAERHRLGLGPDEASRPNSAAAHAAVLVRSASLQHGGGSSTSAAGGSIGDAPVTAAAAAEAGLLAAIDSARRGVVVVVYRARKLQTAGIAFVGPFVDVAVQVGDELSKTTVITKSHDPVWNETLRVALGAGDEADAGAGADLVVSVLDRGALESGNGSLAGIVGQVSIPATRLTARPVREWLELRRLGQPCGALELLFHATPANQAEADALEEEKQRLDQEAQARQLLEAAADTAFGRVYPSSLAWKLPRKRGLAIDMDAWESPWVMLQGPDWRNPNASSPDLTVLRHKVHGSTIELKHAAGSGKSFVFKATGTASASGDRVKICREDAYVADWRFNAPFLVQRMEAGEGAPIPGGPLSFGCWNFEQTDPAKVCLDVFTQLDTDGSGAMEASEVYEAAQVLGFTDMTEEMVAEWIKEHDEDGNGLIDADEFKTLIGVDQARRNMKVATKESSAELWLTEDGFVLLAHEDKNESIVCVGGHLLPYSVPKQTAWMHLGRTDEARKRTEFAAKEAAKKRAAEEAAQAAALAEEMARMKKENEKKAKAERRRLRELASSRQLVPPPS